jgi:hypothetical protein
MKGLPIMGSKLPMGKMMNQKELIERFAALVTEYGHKWKNVADALNRDGVRTPKGEKWTPVNARAFYQRKIKEQDLEPKSEPGESLPKPPPALPQWLDAAAWEDLKAMLDSWREGQEEPTRISAQRPVFRGERRNTGVHVNKTILARAVEKAKREKVRTGGSLSLLVEWLLWGYIGEPADVLEPG